MKAGAVTFAGAGPGAADLLTIRSRDAIAQADIIVYAGSLVNPEVLSFKSDNAEIYDSASLTLEETTNIMVDACEAKKKVLRLHTGDPAMYGAIAEQIAELDKAGIEYDVIPGVSSVFSAAASLKKELTLPGTSQTVILTRRAGKTPVPEKQNIASLASHDATMGIYLSVSDMPGLVDELRDGGYDEKTPVSVVYRASWPDEMIVTGNLEDIAKKVANAGISRQALVLVGNALSGKGERSLLYDPEFAHGYRDSKAEESFCGSIAVYALTKGGANRAREISNVLGASTFISEKYALKDDTGSYAPEDIGTLLRSQWQNFDAHILIMATGIAVRKCAPLLRSKTCDHAVVVCDEGGSFAISLTGGHMGGANRLAREVARTSGATAVITTATDVQDKRAFDEIAALQGWIIVNPDVIKTINSALLDSRKIGFKGPQAILDKYYPNNDSVILIDRSVPEDIDALVALDSELNTDIPVLMMQSQPLTLGIGCRKGTSSQEIRSALESVLDKYCIELDRIYQIATATAKKDEEGLIEFAEDMGVSLETYSSDTLKAVAVPTPSKMPEKHIGTPSVAEAAALLASKGRLLVKKTIHDKVTIAIAVNVKKEEQSGSIAAVGIGSGSMEGITPEAFDAISGADVVVGYNAYIKQISPLLHDQEVLSSGMRQEIERCGAAIKEALAGKSVAIVCSGDAGVYGMAGLILELLEDESDSVPVTVIPGITSALAAAASLGAPLMNDYATISLSDLLTDRKVILDRLKNVAQCGMPCALYNPRSTKRHELFNEALKIFTDASGPKLACGIVKNARRKNEEIWLGHIADVPQDKVDMSTIVIIGGRDTQIMGNKLITRRGYHKKRK